MDATTIINRLGGYTDLAITLGTARTTVFMWHRTGIPKARALELSKLAKRRGINAITLEVIMKSKPQPNYVPPRRAAAVKKAAESVV